MAKYQVVKTGFSYNDFTFKIGQVFEGQDKGEKWLDKPAITVKLMGKDVAIPMDYVKIVDQSTPLSDTKSLQDYTDKRNTIKSVAKLAGLGGAIYYAHKMGKGTWGYIGFGLLGLIAGGIVGGQVANIILKKS